MAQCVLLDLRMASPAAVQETVEQGCSVADRLPCFFGENHLAEEYSGCTWYHLPELFKNRDAIPASLAARMALSSFWIR